MSPRLSLAILAVATSLAVCHKPSAEQSDQRAQETSAKSAAKEVKEQERYRALLTKEVDWADRRIRALASDLTLLQGKARTEKEQDIEMGRAWRQRLQEDLDAIDRPPPGVDWPALKARIERDLNQDRPPSMPRFFEKPYGI
ncbi:MAG: hypothetical protein QOI41_6925 [Myxococcales bacterium]|nr:hypothetical protein [Myxococcales bacterium]